MSAACSLEVKLVEDGDPVSNCVQKYLWSVAQAQALAPPIKDETDAHEKADHYLDITFGKENYHSSNTERNCTIVGLWHPFPIAEISRAKEADHIVPRRRLHPDTFPLRALMPDLLIGEAKITSAPRFTLKGVNTLRAFDSFQYDTYINSLHLGFAKSLVYWVAHRSKASPCPWNKTHVFVAFHSSSCSLRFENWLNAH